MEVHIKFARLSGGALIVIGADDRRDAIERRKSADTRVVKVQVDESEVRAMFDAPVGATAEVVSQ